MNLHHHHHDCPVANFTSTMSPLRPAAPPRRQYLGWTFWVACVIGFIGLISPVHAHVGDQNVFFEGAAGGYPVRIVVRPPGVIPGLAEISVRVETNGVRQVTVLPIRWSTGRDGAPPPDEARPVRGESNLFSGELWFMQGGAQSVEVVVNGTAGEGRVIVPVNAVATRVLGMEPWLGWGLAGFGTVLVALAGSIVGAAVRESILPAGVAASTRRRRWSGVTIGVALLLIGGFLFLGQRWWAAEARDYHHNRLYRPVDSTARVRQEMGQRILTLERAVDPARNNGPIVPEHGKLMHLFLVREPGLDAFAHLHPVKRDWKTFETVVPGLPAGNYRVYADVTYETGFTETLSATVALPAVVPAITDPAPRLPASQPLPTADDDDAWHVGQPFAPVTSTQVRQTNTLGAYTMELGMAAPLIVNQDTRLQVVVRDAQHQTVPLEEFMGMGGHLILRKEDGAVFTHLHPSGSFSMAAQQLFALRIEGKAPLKVASPQREPICQLPAMLPSSGTHESLAFPYAFPQPGPYRLWIQVKIKGQVFTGEFAVQVNPAA